MAKERAGQDIFSALQAVIENTISDLTKQRDRIDQQIEKLHEAAAALGIHASTAKPGATPTRRQRGENLPLVLRILRQNGPMRVTDIAQAAGLAKSSVQAVLRDERFRQTNDGRWRVGPPTPPAASQSVSEGSLPPPAPPGPPPARQGLPFRTPPFKEGSTPSK